MRNKTALTVFILIIISTLLYLTSEQIKKNSDFCVSCHLTPAKTLHKKKHRLFHKLQPVNLSGYHKLKSKNFACVDCHQGRNIHLKAKIAFLEFYNSIVYFFGNVVEPNNLDLKLMPDENCEFCHKSFKASSETFHGLKPHFPSLPAQCIICHSSHLEGNSDYYFLNTQKLVKGCKRCHPNMSPAFARVLKIEK